MLQKGDYPEKEQQNSSYLPPYSDRHITGKINIVADMLISELRAKKRKRQEWARDWISKENIFQGRF